MPPFLIFVLVLAGIWTLSGITTFLNKQKEAERRRRLREQMARAGVQVPVGPPSFSQGVQTPRQISAAIANRFPDVLLPPSPQRQPRRIAQPRPAQQRPIQQRPIQQQPGQPGRTPRPIPPPPLTGTVQPQRPQPPVQPQSVTPPAIVTKLAPTSAAVVQSRGKSQTPALPRMSAASLARWMTPTTLNQQFLLTEILQPPLALRERTAGQ